MDTRNPNYLLAVTRIFDEALFVRDLGIQLSDCGVGWCETELIVKPSHYQQDRVIHACVQSTLADHTAGAAATSLIADSEIVLTAEYKINLLKAASCSKLLCRSKVIKPGRRIIVAESDVWNPEDGSESLIAKAIVTLAVINKK